MTNEYWRIDRSLTRHDRADRLRSPEIVMAPVTLGAARPTRYSFSRTLLRRAVRDRWQVRRSRCTVDSEGRGETVYEVRIGEYLIHFVAFTTTNDESEHTDRVVATNWEITGALVEGELTDEFLSALRSQVPQQEAARLDPRVLVLTRGNRSVRFFHYVVGCLAAGHQPDPEKVGDSAYIMRSTAFYGNGKYGMRSFAGFAPGHPLAVPYRAQFLAAWLFRELSLDMAESCARATGGEQAVGFNDEWRRFFGLGNATGLGLVPYAFNHPHVMHAWASIRELALADVRELKATGPRVALLDQWITRARAHFETGTDADCEPFLNPQQLVSVVDQIRRQFDLVRTSDDAFEQLYRWAQTQNVELTELVVSLLIEVHDGRDDEFDDLLRVDEQHRVDPTLAIGDLQRLIHQRYAWLTSLDLESLEADHFWWLMSDNTEEPRRASRDNIAVEGRDVAIDIALRVSRLQQVLEGLDPTQSVAEFLAGRPCHRMAVERVAASDVAYGEPRDNACDINFLPLQLQRFQLAMYGMDNFKPKSTDWLRVTSFQGAPRITDLASPDEYADQWSLPPRPRSGSTRSAT